MKKIYLFLPLFLCFLTSNLVFGQACPSVSPSAIIVNANPNGDGTCDFGIQYEYQKNSANNSSIQIEVLINNIVVSDECAIQNIGMNGGAPDSGTEIVSLTNIACDADVQLRWTGWANATCGGSDCGGATLIPIGALPVELISFDARLLQNSRVQLDWATASEENNDYFELQHSTDGSNFRPLEKIQGQGTTSIARHYTYTHLDPSKGNNYYRIKQVDLDGRSEIFDVVSVAIEGDKEYNVYPSQTYDIITLESSEVSNEDTQINIYNSTGLLIKTGTLIKGDYQLTLNVSDFPSGAYLIRFVDSSQDYTVKQFFKIKN